ncbi:hypothetical protein I79_010408 [Cricetulus griseus]|uniref:Uncharacterized protein n=1 Tax=Cricetulus griseus TaxID=10029 RepID=G3HIE7_CRIGR|nr:hypothetical protein I79_010408 [Cricetulus griseus]
MLGCYWVQILGMSDHENSLIPCNSCCPGRQGILESSLLPFQLRSTLGRFAIEERLTQLVKIWKTLVLQLIGLSVSIRGEIVVCLIAKVWGGAKCQFQGELVHYKTTIPQEPSLCSPPSCTSHGPLCCFGSGRWKGDWLKFSSARSPQKLKGDAKGDTHSRNLLSQGVYTL